MNEMTDSTLEVLEQHHEQAFKWAMSCCNYDREEAKDLMQSVYVEMISKKAVFRGESSLLTWLYTIIHRIGWRQSKKHKISCSSEKWMDTARELSGNSCEASKQIKNQQQSEDILVALKTLSVQQRQMIELVYYRDFTIEEAASITGSRLGTARTHFHRAKQNLAKSLKHLKEL
jgi:RNA polymerase sigma-70 factor, ECF subfamily